MSTEPARTRSEGTVLEILLSPLRAVERTRGWRRLGLLLLYAAVAVPILAILWRRSQLNGLPDVGDTFDLPGPRPAAGVPDDRNAFVPYGRAAEHFRDMSPAEGRSFSQANLRWSRADATLRGWVAEHREAISLLRAGSGRPEAYLERPGLASGPSDRAAGQEVIRRLSWIGNAAIFEAGRLRAEGDPAGAWAVLKAVVRVSRDMERALPTAWCRTTAIILVQFAREPVAEWAGDGSVGIPLLRQALDDLAAIEPLTPPLSHFYRGEYEAADESMEDLSPRIAARAQPRSDAGTFDPSAFAPGLAAFLRGEPERSRRVLRLLAANDLAWCDRPIIDRPAWAVPRLRIYEPNPSAPPASRALPPGELARWAESALIDPAPPWRTGDIEKGERTDRWSLGQLKEAVAVPLFTRETGRPPASPAEALRHYDPIPGDAPDRDEARPLPEGRDEGPLR
ncbi:hypothetical protein OJF2_76070 [Aquisphaera giovannonii]|uniref:Uncharacterized protein n=1 Tax=Aquisphaera giovannonii TaxID=406548 RepID=A0A5B9WG52_9BACT|nr:hypothetical protein [Aquisphaera giovannonii]QEH38995.1 hypothetical protein OJF2_76070 [Aquisphaera giovannonii]